MKHLNISTFSENLGAAMLDFKHVHGSLKPESAEVIKTSLTT